MTEQNNTEKKKPFYKNKWFIGVVVIIVLAGIFRESSKTELKKEIATLKEENSKLESKIDTFSKEPDEKNTDSSNLKNKETKSNDSNTKDMEKQIDDLNRKIKEKDEEIKKLKDDSSKNNTTKKPSNNSTTKKPKDTKKDSSTGTKVTKSQEQAIKMAEQYINYTAFSKSGLVEQLKFEGFSDGDAKYAVENINVDWQEQANKMAKQYLDYTAFSRQGLIDQLTFEGFNNEQAATAATEAGL